IRIERHAVAALERVIRKKDVERAAFVEHADVGDHVVKLDRIAVVAIDAVQTRWPARYVVRLRLYGESEARHIERPSGQTARPLTLAGRHAARAAAGIAAMDGEW